jgi:thiamine biosynthesis lipoprotein ApbE
MSIGCVAAKASITSNLQRLEDSNSTRGLMMSQKRSKPSSTTTSSKVRRLLDDVHRRLNALLDSDAARLNDNAGREIDELSHRVYRILMLLDQPSKDQNLDLLAAAQYAVQFGDEQIDPVIRKRLQAAIAAHEEK